MKEFIKKHNTPLIVILLLLMVYPIYLLALKYFIFTPKDNLSTFAPSTYDPKENDPKTSIIEETSVTDFYNIESFMSRLISSFGLGANSSEDREDMRKIVFELSASHDFFNTINAHFMSIYNYDLYDLVEEKFRGFELEIFLTDLPPK